MSVPPPDDYNPPSRPLGTGGHSGAVTAVAIVNYIFGALQVVAGLAIIFGGTAIAAMLFGAGHEAVVNQPGMTPEQIEAAKKLAGAGTGFFAMVFGIIGFCFIIFAIPTLLAGMGVMNRRQWGRILTIVLGILAAIGGVMSIPVGLVQIGYAVFVLVVLFTPKFAAEFK